MREAPHFVVLILVLLAASACASPLGHGALAAPGDRLVPSERVCPRSSLAETRPQLRARCREQREHWHR